jgi:hypothetical protein
MDIEGVLAITLIFGGGTLFALSLSPVGRALAERIRSPGGIRHEPDPELQADVEALRAEVSELHERMDFAERLLAQRQEPGKIGAGE